METYSRLRWARQSRDASHYRHRDPKCVGFGTNDCRSYPLAEGLALYNTAAVGIQTVFTVENASAIGFYQNTDAGFGLFTILGGDSSEPGGSQLNFYDNASASNGYFYTTIGGSPSAEGGTISFYGNSAGNNSWITNKAAIDPGAASGGTTTFHDNSTAGANITNESGPVTGGLQNRGSTTFMDNSDANHVSVFCDGAQSATKKVPRSSSSTVQPPTSRCLSPMPGRKAAREV